MLEVRLVGTSFSLEKIYIKLTLQLLSNPNTTNKYCDFRSLFSCVVELRNRLTRLLLSVARWFWVKIPRFFSKSLDFSPKKF